MATNLGKPSLRINAVELRGYADSRLERLKPKYRGAFIQKWEKPYNGKDVSNKASRLSRRLEKLACSNRSELAVLVSRLSN